MTMDLGAGERAALRRRYEFKSTEEARTICRLLDALEEAEKKIAKAESDRLYEIDAAAGRGMGG